MNFLNNVPQLHAGRDFNNRTSCKKLHFNLLRPFLQNAETRLAYSCCCRAAFFARPGLVLSIQGYCRTELLFLRMINCPVAQYSTKKKLAHCNLRQMADLFSAKPRQRKPSGTKTFHSRPDASAKRKPRLMLPTTAAAIRRAGI